MFRSERCCVSYNNIQTGFNDFDILLDGGLPVGEITQIYGGPGSGKTNIALTATTKAALNGNHVVYIDTEGVSGDRLQQLIAPADIGAANRISIKHVQDFDEQTEAIEEIAVVGEQASFIVVDSLTNHYRLHVQENDYKDVNDVLIGQMLTLLGFARRFDLGVLLTNQVTVNPETGEEQPVGSRYVTHLTEVMLNTVHAPDGSRVLSVEKHPNGGVGQAELFEITPNGVVTV